MHEKERKIKQDDPQLKIRLLPEVARQLNIKLAELDMTKQEFVTQSVLRLISKDSSIIQRNAQPSHLAKTVDKILESGNTVAIQLIKAAIAASNVIVFSQSGNEVTTVSPVTPDSDAARSGDTKTTAKRGEEAIKNREETTGTDNARSRKRRTH